MSLSGYHWDQNFAAAWKPSVLTTTPPCVVSVNFFLLLTFWCFSSQFQLLFSDWPASLSSEYLLAVFGSLIFCSIKWAIEFFCSFLPRLWQHECLGVVGDLSHLLVFGGSSHLFLSHRIFILCLLKNLFQPLTF